MFLSEQLLQGALSQHHPSTPKIPIEVTVAVDGTTAPTTAADSIVAALTQTLTNDPPRAASSTKHQNEQNWSQSLSAFGKIDSISIPQSIGSMMGDVPLDLQVPLLVLVC